MTEEQLPPPTIQEVEADRQPPAQQQPQKWADLEDSGATWVEDTPQTEEVRDPDGQ